MKPRVRTLLVAFFVATTIFVGCTTVDTGSSGGSNNSAAVATSTPILANGFFAEGSHDVEGGGPPPPPEIEQEEGEETQSHFRAIQIDPLLEDTAGPKFLRAVDMDGDGLLDILSGHTQSQPVQLHLQRRDGDAIRFEAVNLGGTRPIGIIAGIEPADMDQDGALDIVVLVKHTGRLAFCLNGEPNESLFTGVIVILFAPTDVDEITDGGAWEEVILWDSWSGNNERWGQQEAEGRAIDLPEQGGYTSLAVGDIDGLNGPDIVVTSNVPPLPCNTGENTVEVWYNPGAGARNGDSQNITTNATPVLSMPPTFWYPIWIDVDAPEVRDCEVSDVDGDGDLDVIAAYSNSVTRNVRWYRNPLLEQGNASLNQGIFVNKNRGLFAPAWEKRAIGQIDGEVGAMSLGDMDNDGFDDVIVRSSVVNAVLWFRRPTTDNSIEPIFPFVDPPTPARFDFPWQVYALDEYEQYQPLGIVAGDLTGDGLTDSAVAVGGALYWYDHTLVGNVFDQWGRDFVLDDSKANGTTDDPTDLDFVGDGTLINNLVIADLDGDGLNDIVATFDRRVASGLTQDGIIWFRNTLFEE